MGPWCQGIWKLLGQSTTQHNSFIKCRQGRKQAALPAQTLQMQVRTHSYRAFISAAETFLKWSCLSKNIFYEIGVNWSKP